ncbi:MAG: hypothetical protein ACJA1Z_000228 [Patiriisocius sp.]
MIKLVVLIALIKQLIVTLSGEKMIAKERVVIMIMTTEIYYLLPNLV